MKKENPYSWESLKDVNPDLEEDFEDSGFIDQEDEEQIFSDSDEDSESEGNIDVEE